MYLGFLNFYSAVVRPTDRETTAIGKSFVTHSSQKEGPAMLHRATRGSTGVCQKEQGENIHRSLSYSWHRKEWVGQGKLSAQV